MSDPTAVEKAPTEVSGGKRPEAAPGAAPSATTKAVRTIAAFEAFKGLLVLAAGLGLLTMIHKDLREIAESLVRHARFDPEGKYPHIFLDWVDHLQDSNMWSLLAIAVAYVVLRFIEAYGLWHERAWGDWLGTLSGAIYVPLEISHLIKHPTMQTAVVFVFNVVVVSVLVYRLMQRRRTMGAHA